MHSDEEIIGGGFRDLPLGFESLSKDARVNEPYHVLTARKGAMHLESGFVYHVQPSGMPFDAFYRISDLRYVCAPWLVLIQVSYAHGLIAGIYTACNLCSQFYYDCNSGKLAKRLKSIASIEQLQKKIESIDAMRGTKTALRALSFTVENTRSPMEIKTVLLLCLPCRMGGFGLSFPQINKEILPDSACRFVNQSKFEGDLCWSDSKIIIEYNGRESHEDAVKDNRRRNDLQALGYEIYFAYYETLCDIEEFRKLAEKISRKTGHRMRLPQDWMKRHLELRRQLGIPGY